MNTWLKSIVPLLGTLVVTFTFGVTSQVFANPTNTASEVTDSQTATAAADAEGEGIAANEASTAVGVNDTLNGNTVTTDASQNDASTTATDQSLTDSANTATTTNTDQSLTDSANFAATTDASLTDSANTATTTDQSLTDSANTADSFNVDNSTNVSINDISMAVADSALSGTVTGNSFGYAEGGGLYAEGNSIAEGALSEAAGITLVSMTTGAQNLVQQSVNVQSNVNAR